MTRNLYLDLLRVLAILLLVPNHAAGMFAPLSPIPFQQEQWAILIVKFIMSWTMPVVMLIAGWATKKSLEQRTVRQFLAERRDRVLYPAIFTLAVCVPLSEAMLNRWQLTMAHGWFLVYLLAFSLIIVAIPASRRVKLFRLNGAMLLVLPLPVLLIFTSFMEVGFWFVLFFAGFYIDSKFARKVALPYIALGIVLLILFDQVYPVMLFARALLGIGLVSLPVTLNRKVPMQRASIVYYILHYPITILLALVAKSLGMGSLTAFAFMMLAMPATIALSWASVRWKVTRVLFGVKEPSEPGQVRERPGTGGAGRLV